MKQFFSLDNMSCLLIWINKTDKGLGLGFYVISLLVAHLDKAANIDRTPEVKLS